MKPKHERLLNEDNRFIIDNSFNGTLYLSDEKIICE